MRCEYVYAMIYDLNFLIMFRHNIISQHSYLMVTNCNGWCIVLVFASYHYCFCEVKKDLVCNVYKPSIKKIRSINGTKLIATSCFKI